MRFHLIFELVNVLGTQMGSAYMIQVGSRLFDRARKTHVYVYRKFACLPAKSKQNAVMRFSEYKFNIQGRKISNLGISGEYSGEALVTMRGWDTRKRIVCKTSLTKATRLSTSISNCFGAGIAKELLVDSYLYDYVKY